MHYLIRDILPLVWQADETIICKIVGHGWHAGQFPARDPRIEIIGPVADLDVVFDAVRLTVVPLRFGAGIKGKVLDSFTAGLPCVMTPIAAEGLTLPGTLSQCIGDHPKTKADLILRLHNNPDDNTRTGVSGYRLASKFSATASPPH